MNSINHSNIALARTVRFVEDERVVADWLDGEAREEAEQAVFLNDVAERRIDDPECGLVMNEIEGKDLDFKELIASVAGTWAAAEKAQQLFELQAARKALGLTRNEEVTEEAVANVSVDLLRKEERVINRKEQAAYFRQKLEDKAIFLREMSYRAERSTDQEFVDLVKKIANQTKKWCEGRQNRERPYSKSAVNALYNEAVHTLVALGVFRVAFTKKEFGTGEECSFFSKPTRAGMVEVKNGADDWALAAHFYEVEDGCKHVSTRGSEY